MAENQDGDVVRLLVDLIRDQARVLSAIAEGVAVGGDRVARVTDLSERMADVLSRLEAHLSREDAANALARAHAETERAEGHLALARMVDMMRTAISSSIGQRIIQTIVITLMAWAGVRFGFVVPGPSTQQEPAAAVESSPKVEDNGSH